MLVSLKILLKEVQQRLRYHIVNLTVATEKLQWIAMKWKANDGKGGAHACQLICPQLKGLAPPKPQRLHFPDDHPLFTLPYSLFSNLTMPPKRASQIAPNSSGVPPIPKPSSKPTSSSSSSSSGPNQSAQDVLVSLWQNYLKTTPQRVKLIDVFMAFLVVVGGLQFLYCIVVGNYVSRCTLQGS